MGTNSERQSKLADEIIEAEKIRSDLLKWKLFICAVLGGAGFGFINSSNGLNIPLLALIPLACLYVDLLCTNQNIRIILIGSYFAKVKNDPYEQFISKRRIAFCLEDWALYGATYIISALLIFTSFVVLNIRFCSFLKNQIHHQLIADPPKSECVVGIIECLAVMMVAGLSIWLTRKTIIAFQLALSHKNFEAEQNIQKTFVTELTRCKILQWIMNNMFVHEKRKRHELMTDYLLEEYKREDAVRLNNYLRSHGTFKFKRLDNGLFPAISATGLDASGYQYAWVRDNVHIAHAHYQWGEQEVAAQTAGSLMAFFQSQRHRMQKIVRDPMLAADPMKRPHVRFDGQQLEELKQIWNHAQNDALGYFLWFYCKLAKENWVPCNENERACLTDLVLYLQAIHYWEDKDSGHWEEVQKVSASSIGAVVAGLREFEELSNSDKIDIVALIARGRSALDEILPHESRPLRRHDASLLFLIYPLQVVSWNQACIILQDVKDHLEGNIGIRRYLNDSYWCADYRDLYQTTERTKDFSDDLKSRDAHVKPGQEAQWCIFDPIISCIYANQPDLSTEANYRQIYHLNRSLRQLTESKDKRLQCPEAYFLEKNQYVPNDHVPLQWTQANLKLAIHLLIETAAYAL